MELGGDIRVIFAFYSLGVKNDIKPVLSGLQVLLSSASSSRRRQFAIPEKRLSTAYRIAVEAHE